MFAKKVVEACTIAAYWVLFIPLLLQLMKADYKKAPFDYFYANSDLVLYAILGYLITYRIVMLIFMQLKSFDLRLWNRLPSKKAQLDQELEETKSYYKNLDVVDGPPATISYSTTRIPKKKAMAAPPPPPAVHDNVLCSAEVHESPKKKKHIKK